MGLGPGWYILAYFQKVLLAIISVPFCFLSFTSMSSLFIRFAKCLSSMSSCVQDGLVQMSEGNHFTLVKFGLVASSSNWISVSKDGSNIQMPFSMWVFYMLSSGCLLVARINGAGHLYQGISLLKSPMYFTYFLLQTLLSFSVFLSLHVLPCSWALRLDWDSVWCFLLGPFASASAPP